MQADRQTEGETQPPKHKQIDSQNEKKKEIKQSDKQKIKQKTQTQLDKKTQVIQTERKIDKLNKNVAFYSKFQTELRRLRIIFWKKTQWQQMDT